jgi:transposase
LLEKLDRIPGVARHTGEELLAELGTHMTRFPTAAHLASCARICPGNNVSAGKRKSGPTGSGNPWLRRRISMRLHLG